MKAQRHKKETKTYKTAKGIANSSKQNELVREIRNKTQKKQQTKNSGKQTSENKRTDKQKQLSKQNSQT